MTRSVGLWFCLLALFGGACASRPRTETPRNSAQTTNGSSSTVASDGGLLVVRQRPARVPGEPEPSLPDASSSVAALSDAGSAEIPGMTSNDALSRIDNEAAWRTLSATPQRETVARTEVGKVVIDLEDNNRVYFLNTRSWEIHYYFIQRFLSRPNAPIPEAEAFWQREYLSLNRRFIEGTILHYRDQDVWAFELIAQDVLDIPRTIQAFQQIRSRVYFGDRLRYHPVPSHHIAGTDGIRAQIPVVTTDELFAGVRYQPLNPGEAYGYLRIFRGTAPASQIRRNDIVVLAETPLDLPVCSAVVTSQLQTPLSHVAVLSANRGTPNMALRNAHQDPRLTALEGRLVHLRVMPQDFVLEVAAQADAERAWERARPAQVMHPRRDNRDVGLPLVTALRMADLPRVGAKAAQLGELTHIRPALNVPRAFAIPFAAYTNYLHANGIDRLLEGFLSNPQFQQNPTAREAALTTVRERIQQGRVDPGLLRRVREQIGRVLPASGPVRFRSSTNAEDLPGFNGAGLYLSTRTPANPTEEQIATALRNVWASVWNFQGFEERSYYRIEHREVAMAILVQESVENDTAIGVAITGNPFDEGRPGLFINVQLSTGSVTGAASGEVPEQLLWYTYPLPGALERLSSSSRNNGRPILSDGEAAMLAAQLTQIQSHFYPTDSWQSGHAMDVEFLIAGPERRIVVVQARPFTMRWDQGRGYARPPGG